MSKLPSLGTVSAYLDRGNIGNAKLQGLFEELLHGDDTRYSVVLLSFYVTYMIVSVPGTLLAKAITPSHTIVLGCIVWSIASAGLAAAQNFPSVVVCRLFLGIGEAVFGQTCGLYYSYWYKKNEISQRLALFIGAGVTSGAFGGLIAYGWSQIFLYYNFPKQGGPDTAYTGISQIKNPKISSWRILFLVESLPSLLLGIISHFALPSRPDKSKLLNEDEGARFFI